MSELGEGSPESIDIPPGTDQVALFSSPFAVVTARQREWDAVVLFLKKIKGDVTVVERTANELQGANIRQEGGDTVVVNAQNVVEVGRLIPYIMKSQGGILKDVTVLLRVDDTERQKELLEAEDWTRFDIGHLPDRPEE